MFYCDLLHRFSPLDGLSPLGGPQNTASRIDQAQLRSDTTGRQPATGPVWRLWAFGTSRERRTSRPRLTPLHLIHSLTLRARSLRGALKLAVLTGIDLNSANAECGPADAMWESSEFSVWLVDRSHRILCCKMPFVAAGQYAHQEMGRINARNYNH